MYDSDILYVLMVAGNSGLSVKDITRHVHNTRNTFFAPVSFEEVNKYVRRFVQQNSRHSESILTKMGKGFYRINEHSGASRQLLLDFKDADDIPNLPETMGESLSLFGE